MVKNTEFFLANVKTIKVLVTNAVEMLVQL